MPRWLGILIACSITFGGFYWLANLDVIAQQPLGAADACHAAPPFVKAYPAFEQPAFDTSQRHMPGLVLIDTAKPDRPPVQRENWKQFGNLGPLARDESGAVFTASIPLINTLSIPETSHLTILRADPQTGELSAWLKLQGDPASGKNYYGITSLAYDCSTSLLYVAALAGSQEDKESGFIAAIDIKSKTEKFRFSGIDALGMSIFGGASGKHLYVGLARRADVVRLPLTTAGKPFGSPQLVTHFDTFNRTRARKLQFSATGMTVSTTQFYFNLMASTEFDQQHLQYTYDSTKDTFQLQRQ